jgi:hypothetical protein
VLLLLLLLLLLLSIWSNARPKGLLLLLRPADRCDWGWCCKNAASFSATACNSSMSSMHTDRNKTSQQVAPTHQPTTQNAPHSSAPVARPAGCP